MSDKLKDSPSDNEKRESPAHKLNKQTVSKKKTKGCSSGKCKATKEKQS